MKRFFVFAMAMALAVAFATPGFAIKKDIEFEGGGQGKVTFSHEVHTEKQGKACKECHPALFKMKKGGTEGVTMAGMGEGKNCGACHNGDIAFDVKSKESCPKCHAQ